MAFSTANYFPCNPGLPVLVALQMNQTVTPQPPPLGRGVGLRIAALGYLGENIHLLLGSIAQSGHLNEAKIMLKAPQDRTGMRRPKNTVAITARANITDIRSSCSPRIGTANNILKNG